MIVYRIVAEKYARKLTASGKAGRWNLQEEFVIYTSASRSLASLELLVNRAGINQGISYKVMVIEIPDSIEAIQLNDLPQNWRSMQMYPLLQGKGSNWYQRNENLVLQVPSAVIPKEHNLILNTKHSNYLTGVKLLEVEDYYWDERTL